MVHVDGYPSFVLVVVVVIGLFGAFRGLRRLEVEKMGQTGNRTVRKVNYGP